MTDKRKRPGGRREPPGGRPPKGNIRLVCYVQPETRKLIDDEAAQSGETLGEVVDRLIRPGRRPRAAGQGESAEDGDDSRSV